MLVKRIVKFAGYGLAVILLLVVLAGGIGGTVELIAFNSDQKHYPPPGELIDVDEITLHLDCRGEGGPTVVVDVGAGNWSTHWRHIQDELSSHGRVCLHDRPGFGWSDSVRVRLTGSEYAEQLHLLLQSAGEEPPYLFVGHSLGGYIGRFYQNMYPLELAGMVLVESGHEDQFDKMPYLTASMEHIDGLFKATALMARFGFFRFTGAPPVFAPLPDKAQQAVVDAATKTPRFWKAMALTFASGIWIAEELKGDDDAEDTPLLILSAGQSAKNYCVTLDLDCQQAQSDWDALQASLLNISTSATRVVHPTSSHDMHVDDPAFIIEHVEKMRAALNDQN